MSSTAEGFISSQTHSPCHHPAYYKRTEPRPSPQPHKVQDCFSPHSVIALLWGRYALHAFICCFNNYLMSASFVPSTVSNVRESGGYDKVAHRSYILLEESLSRHYLQCSQGSNYSPEIENNEGEGIGSFTKGSQRGLSMTERWEGARCGKGQVKSILGRGTVSPEALLWERGWWVWSIVTHLKGKCRTVGTSNEFSEIGRSQMIRIL